MKIEKSQVAGYGLHYYANNQLITNASDRLLLQFLIDIVRNQLTKSLDDQTVMAPMSYLARMSGLDAYRTIPGCLKRLEALGLIKKFKNAISVHCDEYVTLIRHYESLGADDKKDFAKNFSQRGTCILADLQIETVQGCRSELLGMAGSSILVGKTCNLADISASESKKPARLQVLEQQNPENLQPCIYATLQKNLQAMAQNLQGCRFYMDFNQFCELFEPATLQGEAYEFIKSAFFTGEMPSTFKIDLEKTCNLAGSISATLQVFCQKYLQPCSTVINIYNNKNNKGSEAPLIKGENKEKSSEKGYEDFGRVEVVNFEELSKEEQDEQEDLSQQILKRADRSMRSKNSYRNKPFIKIERVKEIIDCLDEVVKSPVDFFLYQFCWGIYDLYCDHYHSSQRIDEEGEPVDEPQQVDWNEIVGAPLPQDEICSLTKNIYDDLLGAVEQGRYVYGDNNEWEVKFGFESFEDFNPYEIFQWSPCTMQDKSVPALRVALDKFYDIEVSDVFTPSKGDKRTKNSQNKKFIQAIMEADEKDLSPMEAAIKDFYQTFVISGEDNMIDEFTDGSGTALESGGGLPDHLLKPWCYNFPSIGYNEFTQILSTKYKPCDGIHKKAYIFSAESVVEWNERNGYHNTVAHQAIQD